MSGTFISTALDATVAAATPLLLAALGELVSERGGVLNLGMEGIMLVGALTGFATTVVAGNPYVGFLAAIICGMLFATIHAFLTITLKANQVVSGVMLTLLGTGLTTYFGSAWVAKSIDGFSNHQLPVVGGFLADLPLIGNALFNATFPEYLALAAVPLIWWLLHRTNVGLEIISVGEDPATADTLGVSVTRNRYLAVLLGGGLAGAAGAALSLSVLSLWVGGMVAGRGWIVIGLVIFAQWRPTRALVGAYLFGLVSVLQLRSQAFTVDSVTLFGVDLSGVANILTNPSLMSTAPYVATIIVLVIVSRQEASGKQHAPTALLQAYSRRDD